MVEHSPMTPNIRQFIDAALPKGGERHVLALGEEHGHRSHYDFMRAHATTLRDEHGVGTLGFEMSPFMNAFSWAYRDGLLPVEKHEARAYMQRLYACYAPKAELTAPLVTDMIDHGLDVISYDARKLETDFIRYQHFIRPMEVLFREDPDALDACRHNAAALESLGQKLVDRDPKLRAWIAQEKVEDKIVHAGKFAFLLYEVEQLKNEYPPYARCLENYEQVIEEGNMREIGHDALSAAILDHAARSDKNIVTISGLMHLMGGVDEECKLQGTFAEHLQSLGSPTTRALLASSKEMQSGVFETLLDPQPLKDEHDTTLYHEMKATGQDFNVPTLLVADRDEVVDARAPSGPPGTIGHRLAAIKTRYEADTDITPGTHVYDAAYVEKSLDKIRRPVFASVLSALRNDSPNGQGRS